MTEREQLIEKLDDAGMSPEGAAMFVDRVIKEATTCTLCGWSYHEHVASVTRGETSLVCPSAARPTPERTNRIANTILGLPEDTTQQQRDAYLRSLLADAGPIEMVADDHEIVMGTVQCASRKRVDPESRTYEYAICQLRMGHSGPHKGGYGEEWK